MCENKTETDIDLPMTLLSVHPSQGSRIGVALLRRQVGGLGSILQNFISAEKNSEKFSYLKFEHPPFGKNDIILFSKLFQGHSCVLVIRWGDYDQEDSKYLAR
jgi:hypothetical protein